MKNARYRAVLCIKGLHTHTHTHDQLINILTRCKGGPGDKNVFLVCTFSVLCVLNHVRLPTKLTGSGGEGSHIRPSTQTMGEKTGEAAYSNEVDISALKISSHIAK